jgi:6-pyruvoyl-tetrahydropterin synthase
MPKVSERTVYCTTRFAATHYYEGAPGSQAHLRHPHRHEFLVVVSVRVGHDDRDVEFLDLKERVDDHLDRLVHERGRSGSIGERSCEHVCEWLAEQLDAADGLNVRSVDVSEDGENGARVLFE